MNESFISVKVDREERPDVDGIYMTACQMLTGSGGWPLTIIMTPDKKPFFAGTYFPRESRFGRIGMIDLIPRVQKMWENDREKILKLSMEVTEHLRHEEKLEQQEPTEAILHEAFGQLRQLFDEENGGFSTAPKFPTAHLLLFLLRYWKRTQDGGSGDDPHAIRLDTSLSDPEGGRYTATFARTRSRAEGTAA